MCNKNLLGVFCDFGCVSIKFAMMILVNYCPTESVIQRMKEGKAHA